MNLLPASADEKRRRSQSFLLHESAPSGYKKSWARPYPAFHAIIVSHSHVHVIPIFVQIFSRTIPGKFPIDLLVFCQNKENMCWEFIGYGEDAPQIIEDPVLCAVEDLVHSNGPWRGTAVDLVAALKQIDSSLVLQASALSRKLNAQAQELQDQYGVQYTRLRNAEGKFIILQPSVDMSAMSDVSIHE